MHEQQLVDLIRDWASAEAADGPSSALRPRIVAIPDVVSHRRGDISAFGDRRTLLVLAAVLAMTVALGGALAIGSGLIRLPWQENTPIHPGAIDPCSLVAGGPSRQLNMLNRGLVDFEQDANAGASPRINSFEGSGCLSLATDDLNSLALVQLRNQITTTDEADDVATRLFRSGDSPFSTGPMPVTVQGHPAWVGRLAVIWDRRATDSPYRVGLAVSADPYFFIVVPEVQTPLHLSDDAGRIWWVNHMEPQAQALAGELLQRLGR